MYKVLFYEPEAAPRSPAPLEAEDIRLTRACYNGALSPETGEFDAVLLDARNGDRDYLVALSALKRQYPVKPIVVLAHDLNADTVISSTARGAHSCLVEPFLPGGLTRHLRETIESYQIAEPFTPIPVPTRTLGSFVGTSTVMQRVYQTIGQIAEQEHPALILGETGTGKELAAHAIHSYSLRRNEPFIVLHCSAIPETLIESELFGHERGAFTNAHKRRQGAFELAGKGTVFLDEIGNTPVIVQEKLLRITQEKDFKRIGGTDVIKNEARIITATNVNLEKKVAEGTFRHDLYHRLNTFTLTLPALRDHAEDISQLALFFIHHYSNAYNRITQGIANSALNYLVDQTWAGNVRQLENVIKQTLSRDNSPFIKKFAVEKVLRTNEIDIHTQALQSALRSHCESALYRELQRSGEGNVSEEVLKMAERIMYEAAWVMCEEDQTKISKVLGVSRPTVRDKTLKYGIVERKKK